MLRSLCSLRSAQCATLIALAAAAGIARVESERMDPKDDCRPEKAGFEEGAARPAARTAFYTTAAGIAPWLQAIFCAAESLAEIAAPIAQRQPQPLTIMRPFVVALGIPALSARTNWYPFAVGPPAFGLTPTPRANRTTVPGDSLARGTTASRIALDVSPLVERALRATENKPEQSSRRFPNPLYASRGITGKFLRPPASLGARAGTAAFTSLG